MTTQAVMQPHDPGAVGVVNTASAEIDISDAAARQLIASLPAGAVGLKAWIEVVTAFNAGTSNLLTMGTGAIGGGTAADYVATVTEGTPGVYVGVGDPAPFAALAAAADVYVYYTPGATGGTTGKAIGYIQWIRTADNG